LMTAQLTKDTASHTPSRDGPGRTRDAMQHVPRPPRTATEVSVHCLWCLVTEGELGGSMHAHAFRPHLYDIASIRLQARWLQARISRLRDRRAGKASPPRKDASSWHRALQARRNHSLLCIPLTKHTRARTPQQYTPTISAHAACVCSS